MKATIPSIAWVLAIMAVAFGLSEGTATDWSALHVTEVAQVDSTTVALGLVAVSGFMVLIRLLGDRLVGRYGRRAVVGFGGGGAAVGAGPALMRFLVNHLGIHHAMAVPALLCAGIVGLAATMPRSDAGLTPGH